jgi:hypothetical protein
LPRNPLNRPGRHPELHRDLAHAYVALLEGSTDADLGLRLDPRAANRLAAAGAMSVSRRNGLYPKSGTSAGGRSEPTQIPTRKDAPTADINEFMAAKEALALAKAFMRIGNEKLRQRCVSLVNELGTEQRSG